MARPRKSGLDYFPFDVDFFEDEKIVAIAGEFGIKGEITAIKLLCAIYRNGYFIEWSEMMQMKMLKSLPGVSVELLNSIVTRLVKWGFFDETLFSSTSVLSSRGIQTRYFQAINRRAKTEKPPYLLVSACNMSTETPLNREFMSTETPQSKVKERINKKSTDVDKKCSSSSSINEEIEILKTDEDWLEHLCMLHSVDKNTLFFKLSEFKSQCIADGKLSHQSTQDLKQHFNSWLRLVNKKTSGGARVPTMAEKDAERARKNAERELHEAECITFEEYLKRKQANKES